MTRRFYERLHYGYTTDLCHLFYNKVKQQKFVEVQLQIWYVNKEFLFLLDK